MAGNRADINDAARTFFEHALAEDPAAQENTCEIDGNDVLPLFKRGFFSPRVIRVDAGIVDEDIRTAEARGNVLF